MRKIGKVSLLMIVLSTGVVGGNFYLSNFANDEIQLTNSVSSTPLATQVGSDKFYLQINNVQFEEDLGITVKYTLQRMDKNPLSLDYLNDNMYGLELMIMDKGSTPEYGGTGMIESVPVEVSALYDNANIDTGVGTLPELHITNSLYTAGASYDAYFVWHEYDSVDPSLWYSSTAKSFAYPVSDFPTYSLKTEWSGATQTLLSFTVDYDDSLAGMVEPYDTSFFFNYINLYWDNNKGDDSVILTSDLNESNGYHQGNFWLEWDEATTSFTYYGLVDDLDETRHEAYYQLQYNTANFGTNTTITGEPIPISAGNLYNDLPFITYTVETAATPTSLDDYKRVKLNFTLHQNENWKAFDDAVETALGSDASNFELNPTNCVDSVVVREVTDETGEYVDLSGQSLESTKFSSYEETQSIEITGLYPGTKYTALATLNLNPDAANKVFSKDSVTIPISFSTLPTVDQPKLTYVGDNDLDNTDITHWYTDELVFNLQPGTWAFGSDLILPGELFDAGTLEIKDYTGETNVYDIDQSVLSQLKEGDNVLDTGKLGIVLDSDTRYSFTLKLEYSDLAEGLFNQKNYIPIVGSFKTRPKITAPRFSYTGMNVVEGDKNSVELKFNIKDKPRQFVGVDGQPLTLEGTFDKLYITEIHEVTSDGSVSPDDELIVTEEIDSSDLVTDMIGDNKLTVSNVKGNTSYEFTAELVLNEVACDPETGWIVDPGRYTITERFSTASKFKPINIDVEVLSTDKMAGSSKWQSTVQFSIPTGDSATSGINSPGADIVVGYELTNGVTGEVVQSNTIDTWTVDTLDPSKSIATVEFQNLDPNTSYVVATESTYNETVIESVSDDSEVIITGENAGMTNDKLVAEWGFGTDNVELTNTYDDVFVKLAIADPAYATPEFMDGIESIYMTSPSGAKVAETTELLSTTLKPMLYLEDEFKPGDTLSGYKIKVNNDDVTMDSGTEYTLPDLVLPYLLNTNITQYAPADIQQTYATFFVNFANANNINSINTQAYKVEGSSESFIWGETLDRSNFENLGEGSFNYEIKLPNGILEANSNYKIKFDINYIDGVADDTGVETSFESFSYNFTTSEKGRATFNEPEFTSTTTTIKSTFGWDNNTSSNTKIKNVKFELYSPKDEYTSPIDTQVVTIPEGDVSGAESVEFIDLDPGIEYQIKYKVIYEGEDESTVIPSTIIISTQEKSKEYSSTIALEQLSENSIGIDYSYTGLSFTDTDEVSGVKQVDLNLYEGSSTSGTPSMTLDNVLDASSPTYGEGQYVFEDESIIKPGYQFTVEEVVTYNSFNGYLDGAPIYDQETFTDSITIVYDSSSFEVDMEFEGDNSINLEMTLNNPEEFELDGYIDMSLETSSGVVGGFIDGYYTELDNTTLDKDDLLRYKVDSESTAEKYVYKATINSVYVPKDKTVTFKVKYSDVVSEDKATQGEAPYIDPNSIKALARYDYSDDYIYDLSIKTNREVNLQTGIHFTEVGSLIEETQIEVLEEELVTEITNTFDATHLYIKVDSSIVNSGRNDFRNLDFLKGRYIVVEHDATAKSVDFTTQSAYRITSYGKIKLPREPLTSGEITAIIIGIILFFLLIWLVLTILSSRYDRERWYEYALKRANGYYFMHRQNMVMYGWTHKYSEYEALMKLNVPKLREYAKKMNIPIPYRLNKRQMVDILSLLNETEVKRMHEYFDYEITIPERVKEDLLIEFQKKGEGSKWMKRRFDYVMDRAVRMQAEDYIRTPHDKFVDFIVNSDRRLRKFNNAILTTLRIKKKEDVAPTLADMDFEKVDVRIKIEDKPKLTTKEQRAEAKKAIKEREALAKAKIAAHEAELKEIAEAEAKAAEEAAAKEAEKEAKKAEKEAAKAEAKAAKEAEQEEVSNEEVSELTLEEKLSKLTRPKLLEIAGEIYDVDSLADYDKNDLVELLKDEDITLEDKSTSKKSSKSTKETKAESVDELTLEEKLSKLTRPKLLEIAGEIYDVDSLADYDKNDLVELLKDEDITLEDKSTSKKSSKSTKEVVEETLEEKLSKLSRPKLLAIAGEIYDVDSLADYDKNDLVELLKDEDIDLPSSKKGGGA